MYKRQTGHTCSCLEEEGAKFTSTVIGKGTANVFITVDAVSYTHLDVYKRQALDSVVCRMSKVQKQTHYDDAADR